MNNGFIALENNDEKARVDERLRSEEARIINIIEAIQTIRQTKAWSTLKNEIYDNLVNVLEKDIKTESMKEDPDPKKLNRLTGELKWASRFSDLEKFENEKKVELQRIRIQLYGNRSE